MTAAQSPEGAALADAVIELGALALAFGRIDRRACYHPDQLSPESHTDHTVMLAWVAPSLAALPQMISRYERQEEAEARFVRAVDKDVPKIVHFQDVAAGLAREGIPAAELAGICRQQASDISVYAAEFTALTQLRHELAARVVAMVTRRTTALAPDLAEPLHPNGGRISPEEAQAG